MKNKKERKKCKICDPYPSVHIVVEDINNPICPDCGEKLLTHGSSSARVDVEVVGTGYWIVKVK